MGKRIRAEESLGVRYGKLVVVEILPPKDGKAQARAVCDCGAEWVGRVNALRSGNTTSCGCEVLKFEDFTGRKFGRWTVLECVQRSGLGKPTLWRCVCECGTISDIQAGPLKSGLSLSCGCLAVELKRARGDGRRDMPEYGIWLGIKARVFNKNSRDYKNYGGRGITICDRWLSDFWAFYRDMGPRPSPEHSVERKKNDESYSPENCVWGTRIEQANNNRGNVTVTLDGVTRTLAQWCREYGVNYYTVNYRINTMKMDARSALERPVAKPFVAKRSV